VDVWLASYIGAPLVYGFQRVGSGCAPISKGAVAAKDSLAVWMGKNAQFWIYDGHSVLPLDCDVLDYVAALNSNQVSKVTAVHMADQGEVWWFYPSEAATECDRYVAWAYRESQRLGRNVWTIGTMGRTAGFGGSVFANPLMVDAAGLLWEHETGLNWGTTVPFIETGPFEIGQGDYMAEVQRVIPDELLNGNLEAELYGRFWPDGAEFTSGPFVLSSPTDMLFQAREIRVRYTTNAVTAWRLGVVRLEVARGDPL